MYCWSFILIPLICHQKGAVSEGGRLILMAYKHDIEHSPEDREDCGSDDEVVSYLHLEVGGVIQWFSRQDCGRHSGYVELTIKHLLALYQLGLNLNTF